MTYLNNIKSGECFSISAWSESKVTTWLEDKMLNENMKQKTADEILKGFHAQEKLG